MQNRILMIGDTFWGAEPGAPELAADLLLCNEPSRPFEFFLSTNPRNTFGWLLANCPREILGRQAGITLLCIGWKEILDGMDAQDAWEGYRSLLLEIRHNSNTKLWCVTLPAQLAAEGSRHQEGIRTLNGYLQQNAALLGMRLLDFERICSDYQTAQAERMEWARNLAGGPGQLAPLGRMLLAKSIAESLK